MFASNGAYLLFLVAVASGVVVVLLLIADGGPRLPAAGLASVVMAVFAGLAAFVVAHFQQVVEAGRVVEGTVTRRTYLRNSWRIEFTYTLDGRQFPDHLGVVAFRPRVAVGDQVIVAVDPTDPTSALLPVLLRGRGPVPCLDVEPAQATPTGTLIEFHRPAGCGVARPRHARERARRGRPRRGRPLRIRCGS